MDKRLEELSKQIELCTRCPLREGASCPVPGLGDVGATYMLLGEAPGREEDRTKVPFVGLSGRRLSRLLALANINENDCYFTNVVKCRPPKNRDPKKAEIAACTKWLMEEIKLVQPEFIITLGRVPLSLFSPYGIKSMHGCIFEFEIPDEETSNAI